MTRTVIGTFNPHYKLRPARVEKDLVKLIATTNVSVLGLQEFARESRVPMIERLQAMGWEYVRPDDLPAQRQVPILWDNTIWEAVHTGSQRVNAEVLAEEGAGGAFIESKWATWVFLRRRSDGVKIAVINHHAPASVQDDRKPLRQAALVAGIESVANLARTFLDQTHMVVITGDMNADYRRRRIRNREGFPVRAFAEIGLKANWAWGKLPVWGTHRAVVGLTGPTSGRRLIDYVFSNRRARNSRILRGYASDHRPVLVAYTI